MYPKIDRVDFYMWNISKNNIQWKLTSLNYHSLDKALYLLEEQLCIYKL